MHGGSEHNVNGLMRVQVKRNETKVNKCFKDSDRVENSCKLNFFFYEDLRPFSRGL